MPPVMLRRVLRWGHLIASGVIGTYLYSPLSDDPIFYALTAYVVFPAMALSGLWMWNQGRIGRMFKRASS